jgi:hypothetical protein
MGSNADSGMSLIRRFSFHAIPQPKVKHPTLFFDIFFIPDRLGADSYCIDPEKSGKIILFRYGDKQNPQSTTNFK